MNEQFQKLMNQTIQECKPDDKPSKDKTLQRFAELIIQDCIEQVKLEQRNMSHLLTNPPQNGGIWDACNNIRRHFGVK